MLNPFVNCHGIARVQLLGRLTKFLVPAFPSGYQQ